MKPSFQSMSEADLIQAEKAALIYLSAVIRAISFQGSSWELSKSSTTDDIFVACVGLCQFPSFSVLELLFNARQLVAAVPTRTRSVLLCG